MERSGAKWIWMQGDYEIYHSYSLHTGRLEFGAGCAPLWNLPTHYPSVMFLKKFTAPKRFSFTPFCKHADCSAFKMDGKVYPFNEEITVEQGEHSIRAEVMCLSHLPSIYICSEFLKTDETWLCSPRAQSALPVGCEPNYSLEKDDPCVFPFSYRPIHPTSVLKKDGGYLYDYGKETFARLTVRGIDKNETVFVYYGESEEEATDHEFTMAYLKLHGKSVYRLEARAFRFIHIITSCEPKVKAEYEFLPLDEVGSFECEDPLVNQVYRASAYTLSLNSRQFYLDGVKRDRWVWSGDAYQSFMANRYLHFDPNIIKRTIRALLGKPPYVQHVNTIDDYSLYLIIAVAEYFDSTGDRAFVKEIFPRLDALYSFVSSRTNEKDYICEREGDWIFIDWSEIDKTKEVCAEQILYWQTKKSMAKLCSVLGTDGARYEKEADELKGRIERDFWNGEKKAFVDCVGSSHITRHANIFAILYDFVPIEKQKTLLKTVLDNAEITPITTPYFEFFELSAKCKIGELSSMQEMLVSYWGGMIKRGATTIWERFDPKDTKKESLAMYGYKYGCSLCHAWGAGPVYLLGKYCLGVSPTDTAYQTFRISPNLGNFEKIKGKVPLPNGNYVAVSLTATEGKFFSTADGGTVELDGKRYPLQKNQELKIQR